MIDRPITDIMKQVRFILPEDKLSKAVTMLRMSQSPALPVTQNGRVIGLVTESDVLKNVSDIDADNLTVEHVMRSEPSCASISMSIAEAADMMKATGNDVLPVIDEYGNYRGLVTRSDILAAAFDVMRPPTVGGMATPLGVYLTTGAVSGGAGNIGLFLTGIALMLMMEASRLLLWGAAVLADRILPLHLIAQLSSPFAGTSSSADAIYFVLVPLQLILMMLFLRLSSMAGYHAAEHQVVHTIEAGESLIPEIVSQMPRPHPRCGTNLMVAASMFVAISSMFSTDIGIMVALVVVVIGWRTIGFYLQQFVTTKPANRKQLQSGIKAGEEILEKYRREPNKSAEGFARIWNMGIIQVFLGFSSVMMLDSWISKLLKIPSLF